METHHARAHGSSTRVKVEANAATCGPVAGVDLRAMQLSPGEIDLLRALSDRRQDYLLHGRGREALAMAAAMQIVWRKLCEPEAVIDRPHLPDAGR